MRSSPSGRSYDRSAHAGLGLLPGAHEGKSSALDFRPILVLHFCCISTGLGLLHKSVHALFPIRINGNRPALTIPDVQEEFGGFLKEFFAAGELPALNGLINPLLEVGGQGNVYHAVLQAVLYAKGLPLSIFRISVASRSGLPPSRRHRMLPR